MPVFELTGTRSGRMRVFVRAQLPLLAATIFVCVEGAWALPETARSTSAILGALVIALSSALFVCLPWERWSPALMIMLALLDVVGVAFLRLAYFAELPSVGILSIFPVVWLCYAFRRWAVLVAVAGTLFITILPSIAHHDFPHTRMQIAQIVTLPIVIIGLAVALGEAARQLAANRRSLVQSNDALKASLQQVQDSGHLARSIFDSVSVALAFYDADHRLLMANSLAEQAVAAAGFRLDRPPYAGPHVLRADRQTPIPFEEQVIPRALRGDLEDHEMEWIGPPGHQIAIVAASQQIRRADGTLWGTLIAAHDITALGRSIEVKDEFITTVSHELRTPLTSIIGYVELLADDLPSHRTDAALMLGTIERNARTLQQRVQFLLDTADRRRSLELRPTDLSALAARMLITFAAQSSAAQVSLSFTESPPAWASVDPARIEQALENVVSNAIKYTPAGGGVDIGVHGGDSSVEIIVTDSGVGMTQDEQAQAFDTFWRADGARRDAVQGIGIGLALVRDILTAHHGTAEILSAPEAGTTVTLRVPRES